MKPEKPIDAFALSLLREGGEKFEDVVARKSLEDACQLSGKAIGYAIVLFVEDTKCNTHDVFSCSDVPPEATQKMLRAMLSKFEAKEPTVREQVPPKLPMWWL